MLYSNSNWLILIISLPTSNATVRMRLWRALKGLGSVALRDGVYLLPAAEETGQRTQSTQALLNLVQETEAGGGNAYLLQVTSWDESQAQTFIKLFDRSAEYLTLLQKMAETRVALPQLSPPVLRRTLKGLQREFQVLREIDFFPGPTSEKVQTAWRQLETAALAFLAPGEPQAVVGGIPKVARSHYQKRLWVTRCHLWVDRLASAWLIHRFIDRAAQFLWLAEPQQAAAEAVGFDFDGATFTHVGQRVTFEVLLASFGLEEDLALRHLGMVVHYLDVGGIPVAEAEGLEMILTGACHQLANDDALLAEASKIFDFFYTAFKEKFHA